MAPRRSKSEKVEADAGSELIIDYLKKQKYVDIPSRTPLQASNNAKRFPADTGVASAVRTLVKPVDTFHTQAIDISANLHNKVTKSHAAKLLKTLHENQLIAGKIVGKQAIYHAIQNPADALSPIDLAALDDEIAKVRDAIATTKAEERMLRVNLISLNATVSTDELRSNVRLKESQKKGLQFRLEPLRKGEAKPVPPEEKAEADRLWLQWARRAKARKKICMEIWDMVSEELPEGTTKEDLWMEWGLEEDDD